MTESEWLKKESENQMIAITDAAKTVEGYIYSLVDEIEKRDLEIEKLEKQTEVMFMEIEELKAEIEMLEASYDN